MSKYEFARRLKCMVREECEIIKAEMKVAQKSAKYYEEITSLKTILNKQDQEMSKHRKEVKKLKQENEKIENYIKRLEDRLYNLVRNNEQMQVDYNQILQKQITQRRNALLEMDCTRSIKLATKTFFKLNALPQFAQGVIIKEMDSSSEWKPFSVDLTKHTQKELQDIIWDDSEVDSVNKKTWESLIMGDILDNANKFKPMETEHESVCSMR